MGKIDDCGAGPIRLVIADDQAIYREGLCDLVAHWRDFIVVGTASDGWEAVELYRKLQPHLILLDVHMPRMNGVETLRCILSEFPAAHVVVMSISNQNPKLLEAIEAGACGYFLKNIYCEQLRNLLIGWAAQAPQRAGEGKLAREL